MVEFEVANKRITQMTGARFGAAYQALAEEGTTVMDSLDAATALADFALARALGVQSYPTLLFVDGREVTPPPAVGTPLEMLNQSLDSLLG